MSVSVLSFRRSYDTEIECTEAGGIHGTIAGLALGGLLLWNVGFLVFISFKIWKLGDARQTDENLRRYGYFYVGLEPTYWWWELAVKCTDVMLVNLIAYTNIVPDNKARLLMYGFLSGIMLAMHVYYQPFDERRTGTSDALESFALLTRFCTSRRPFTLAVTF